MPSAWARLEGEKLAQGDFLPGCLVPIVPDDFGTQGEAVVEAGRSDLVILTQSCDLDKAKTRFVSLCPVHSLAAFEQMNTQFRAKGRWEEVRKGRVAALHLLPSPEEPGENRKALVVDFRLIVSLPFGYVAAHAQGIGSRWRLQSPFVEHFSQAFGLLFMRVGLPDEGAIPRFN